jgi:hypothetical protein
MHLIVCSSAALIRQYHRVGARRLLRRLATLEAARRGAGLATLRLDPELGLPAFSVPSADSAEPSALRAQLLTLADALSARSTPIASALLIGGPSVLPFFPAPNPVDDGEPFVPCDYRYAEREDDLLMDWPVGRLPAGPDDDPRVLLRLLAIAALLHRAPRRPQRAFGYSAAAWQRAAAAVYAQLDAPAHLLLSPPVTAQTLERSRLDGATRLFCNLHGVPARPTWYGEAVGGGQLDVAMRPRDLVGLSLVGAAVVCASCYAAFSPAYNLGDSMGVQMLRRGAACFIGATGISYGPASLPLLGADLLAYHTLGVLRAPGVRVGEAFRLARERTLADTLRRQGALDDDDVKTLAQFVLYGDPALTI